MTSQGRWHHKEGDITRKVTSQGRRHHKGGDITRNVTSQGRRHHKGGDITRKATSQGRRHHKEGASLIVPGMVEQLIFLKDGKVGTTAVKYFVNRKSFVIKRPMNKLCLWEPNLEERNENVLPRFLDQNLSNARIQKRRDWSSTSKCTHLEDAEETKTILTHLWKSECFLSTGKCWISCGNTEDKK